MKNLFSVVIILIIVIFISCKDDLYRDSNVNYNCSCTNQTNTSAQCKGLTSEYELCQTLTFNCCGYCYIHTSQYDPWIK